MSDHYTSTASHDGSESPRRLPYTILVCTGALLGLTLLAMGGILPWVACVFGIGAAGLLALTLWHQRGSSSSSWPLVTLVFGVLSLITLAQCIPLPIGLLRLIAPDNADIWIRSFALLGEGAPSMAPISVAPEHTLVEAVKWGGYGCVAWVGYFWARERGLESVATLVLGIATLAAVTTALHGLLQMKTVFGLYAPTLAYPRWRVGPLLNANHLSGLLALGTYGGLSMLIAAREPPTGKTALVLAATAASVLGVVLLASRAAVALLVVGALLLPLTLLKPGGKQRRRQSEPKRTGIALAASVFVTGAALALFGYREDVLMGLGDRDISKLQVLRDSVPLIREHWRVGLGRGAFESVYFAYKTVGRHEFWSRPENLVVQWVSEWGAPISLAAGAAFAFAAIRARAWRSSVTARVLMLGLLLLTAHNLLDYSLEVPAIAATAAFLFGALCGAPGSDSGADERAHAPRRARQLRSVALGYAALLLAGALGTCGKGPEGLDAARKLAQTTAQNGPDEAALSLVTSLIRRFPAEPYFPLIGGVVTARTNPAASLPWFNRALERAPNMGAVHLGLAETLAMAGFRHQALLETRLALSRDPASQTAAVVLTTRIARTAAEVVETAPMDKPYALEYLESVARTLPPNSPITAALRDTVLEQQPCSLALREAGIRDLLTRMSAGAAPCAGPDGLLACRRLVEPEITKVATCPDGVGLASRLTAELLWASGEQIVAITQLEQACTEQMGDMTECLQLLAERAASAKLANKVRHNVRVVVSRRCQGPEACGQAWAWASRTYTTAGDDASAYVAATKATEIDSVNIELRRLLAETALRAGARERAEAALTQILVRRPDDQAARARLEQIRAIPPAPPLEPAPTVKKPSSPNLPARGTPR